MLDISILLFMMLFHVIDDFYLQGILAKMKQKKWWDDNYPDVLYRHDYIMALVIHSLTWSISIMIPLFIFGIYDSSLQWWLLGTVLINAIIHGIVDTLKANKLYLSLVTDQTIHFIQILITFVLFGFII